MTRIRILKAPGDKKKKKEKARPDSNVGRLGTNPRQYRDTEGRKLRTRVLTNLSDKDKAEGKNVPVDRMQPRDMEPNRPAGSVPQFKPTPSPEPAPSVTPAEPLGREPERFTELTSVQHQPKNTKRETLARQRASMELAQHKKEGGETAGSNKEQQMAAQRLLSQFGFAEQLNQTFGNDMASNAMYDAWIDEVVSPQVDAVLAERRAKGQPEEENERMNLLNRMAKRTTMASMTPDQQKTVVEAATNALRSGTARPSAPPEEPERRPGIRAQAKQERADIRAKVAAKEMTAEEGQRQIDAINQRQRERVKVRTGRREERRGRELDELVEHPEVYRDSEGNLVTAIDLARQMYRENRADATRAAGLMGQKIQGGTRIRFGKQTGGGDPKTEQGTTNLVQGDPILDPATGQQKIDPETGQPMFEMVPEINIRSTAPKRGEGYDPETGEINPRRRSLTEAVDMPTSLTEEEKKVRRRLPSGAVKETRMTSGEQATRRAEKGAQREKEMERRLRAAAVTGSGRGGTRQLTEEGRQAVQAQRARNKRMVTELLAEEIKQDLDKYGLTLDEGATQERANELAALRAQMQASGQAGFSAQQARQAEIDAVTPEKSEREEIEAELRRIGAELGTATGTLSEEQRSVLAGKLAQGMSRDEAVADMKLEQETEEKYSVPEAFETSPAVQTLEPAEPGYEDKIGLDPMGIIPPEDWGATREQVLERMGFVDEDPLSISEEEMAALQAAPPPRTPAPPAPVEAPAAPAPAAPAAAEGPKMMTDEDDDVPEETPVDDVPRGDISLPEIGGTAAPVAGAPDVPLAPPRMLTDEDDDMIQQSMGLYNPYTGDEMLKAALARMYQ